MKAMRAGPLAALGWSCCLIAAAACRSASVPLREGSVPGYPALTLIDADSAIFAGVVRGQLDGGDGDYPRRLERYRYDSRPYGTNSGYPELFLGVEGIDPTLSFPRASQSEAEIGVLVDTRRRILEKNGVPEGKLITYQQCAGAGIPTPPPPRSRTSRNVRPQDVHAGCPRVPEYYLTVGLPIRGQPPGLRNVRDTRGDRVNLDGDVWTVLVDETASAPGGWKRSSYAWLFKRNRSGQLELANTILIGVVQ
jgi:hypothetical protein